MVPTARPGIVVPRTGRAESHLYGTALAAKMWLTCVIVTKKFLVCWRYLSPLRRTGTIACTSSPSKATLPIATSTPEDAREGVRVHDGGCRADHGLVRGGEERDLVRDAQGVRRVSACS